MLSSTRTHLLRSGSTPHRLRRWEDHGRSMCDCYRTSISGSDPQFWTREILLKMCKFKAQTGLKPNWEKCRGWGKLSGIYIHPENGSCLQGDNLSGVVAPRRRRALASRRPQDTANRIKFRTTKMRGRFIKIVVVGDARFGESFSDSSPNT